MPLTEPTPEGVKFFCPTCGALYSVTRTQAPKKEPISLMVYASRYECESEGQRMLEKSKPRFAGRHALQKAHRFN